MRSPPEAGLTVKGCANTPLHVTMKQASIRGKVTGPRGTALRNIPVEAIASDGRTFAEGKTNEAGEFAITELEPGEYVVGININRLPVTRRSPLSSGSPHSPYSSTYFPSVESRSAALVFRVARGEARDLGSWPLGPPLADRKFTGQLKIEPDALGFMVDTGVYLLPLNSVAGPVQRSGARPDGSFVIWGIRGVRYRLAAYGQALGKVLAGF